MMLFAQGIEQRYGKTSPAEIEAQATAIAKTLGYGGIVNISGAGTAEQERKAVLAALQRGDVTGAMGFSRGGNILRTMLQDPHLDPAIKQRITQAILVGSPETKGAIPGIKTIDIPHIADTRHMQMMGRIAQRVAELKNAPATTPSDVTIRSRANQTDIQFLAERGGHSTIAMHRDMPGETGHLSPEFAARLASAAQAYEAQTGKKAVIGEMDRDLATQAEYWRRYQRGGAIAARATMHAPHIRGEATDLPASEFREWMHHGHAKQFGINFPVWEKYGKDYPHSQLDRSYRGKPFYQPEKKEEDAGKPQSSLSSHAKSAGILPLPAAVKSKVDAALRIDLEGFPRGTKTKMAADGMFTKTSLHRSMTA
jgi:hypothetical protein